MLIMAQKHSMGMLTFYKANNATKVDFTHDKSADVMFRKNPHLLEFAKVNTLDLDFIWLEAH